MQSKFSLVSEAEPTFDYIIIIIENYHYCHHHYDIICILYHNGNKHILYTSYHIYVTYDMWYRQTVYCVTLSSSCGGL